MKSFKRLLSYLMTIIMGVILFSGIKVTNTLADEVFKFETDKGYLNYVVDNDEITITDYSGEDTELEIPSEINGKTVTKIGKEAFYRCTNFTKISIPNSVIIIEDKAFKFCAKLKNIELPNSVQSIGSEAFAICINLTSIKIPNSIVRIENSTFISCMALTEVDIPSSVRSIGDYAFMQCENLTNITIPNSVISIGEYAFSSCKNLKDVNIPNSVTEIGKFAFAWCTSLTDINIPNSVLNIGESAFYYCIKLVNVDISSSVEEIGENAFFYCLNLKNINVSENNKAYSDEDGVLFNKDKSKLLSYPSGKKEKSYKVQNSVKTIASCAFSFCSELNSVDIPSSVATVESAAFAGNTDLIKINVDENNINYIDEDGILFSKDKSTLIQYPSGKTEESYKVPSSVKILAPYSFNYCSMLNSIEILNSITAIEEGAFAECNNLKEITIPDSITSIREFTFEGCSELTSITIPNSVTSIEKNAFLFCDKLTINGYKDSYAETYAKENSISFKEIEVEEIQEPEIITTINNFTADKKSPQISGTAIKLSVEATGKGTLQYKFIIKDNKTGNWAKLRDYGTDNTYIWKTKATGDKTLYVDVKDEKGQVIRKSLSYTIKEKVFKAPVIKSFVSDKKSPQISGASIKLSVEATGSGTLQYKFIIKDNKTGNWAKLRDYGKSNIYTWKTKATGDKTLYVDVKNENGQVTRKSLTYTIKEVNYSVNTSEFNKVVYDEMYRLVNEHRNNNGLKSLAVDSVMEECAYGKSKHMSDNNYFSHSYEGKYWWNMYPEKYENACAIGENIIRSYINPNKVYTKEECKEIANELFESWKNSSGHNANMLSENFEAIGFGIYVNSSGYLYGTQEFIKRW